MPRRLAPLLLALACLLPLAARADGRAVVSRGDGSHRTVVEFGAGAVRLQSPELGGGYLLLRDGQAYLVTGGQALSMAGSLSALLGRAGERPLDRFVGIEDSGRRETIAGLPGELYRIQLRDPENRPRSAEAVLSDAPEARELTRALESLGRTFAAGKARNPVFGYAEQLAATVGSRGVLRYGSDYLVQELAPRRFAPSYFDLPSPPADLSALGGLLRALPPR